MAGSLPLRASHWRLGRAAKTPESDDHENRDRHDKRLTVEQHAEKFAPSRHTRASSEAGLAAGRRSVLRFARASGQALVVSRG
jgi:hypothetical protein